MEKARKKGMERERERDRTADEDILSPDFPIHPIVNTYHSSFNDHRKTPTRLYALRGMAVLQKSQVRTPYDGRSPVDSKQQSRQLNWLINVAIVS